MSSFSVRFFNTLADLTSSNTNPNGLNIPLKIKEREGFIQVPGHACCSLTNAHIEGRATQTKQRSETYFLAVKVLSFRCTSDGVKAVAKCQFMDVENCQKEKKTILPGVIQYFKLSALESMFQPHTSSHSFPEYPTEQKTLFAENALANGYDVDFEYWLMSLVQNERLDTIFCIALNKETKSPFNYAFAIKLHQYLSDQGQVSSTCRLADMYMKGRPELNIPMARFYLERAVASGQSPKAAQLLASLDKKK